jgi:rhombotail lipoprotein
MNRTTRVRWRLVSTAACTLAFSGCAWLYGSSRDHDGTTPLVEFLYSNGDIPPVTTDVKLNLPIRVAVSFLPEKDSGYVNSGAQALDREKVVNAIRERFRVLPYVTEIVVVPSYYLHTRKGDGLAQIEQLSQLYKFDLFALVSYDQILDQSLNKNSFVYLTLVGEYLVRGNRNETHTLLDLAVIDPRSRSLVLRSAGSSSLGGNVTSVGAQNHANAQRSKGFELATTQLLDNFQRELTAFETRVKDGSAPVRVSRRPSGGGGSLDWLLLVGTFLMLWKREIHRYWLSRVARKAIFGQRSMVSSRFTREGAR